MAAVSQFISGKSLGLIEKDVNDDVLWTWSYPSISEEDRLFYIRKSQLQNLDKQSFFPFLFSRWRRNWYYIYTSKIDDTDQIDKVSHVALVLVAKDFNPEKYEILSKILVKKYKKTGNPAAMLESYLSVVTKGVCSTEENGRFSVKDFDAKRSQANVRLKELIETYGVETIIIYTALLLKKKVVVYYPYNQLDQLIQCIRSLPALVWHRHNWDIAFPHVELNEEELENLKESSNYVAGFTDASVEGRSDLYDIFVNAATGQISIAPNAKESFVMGKLHKDTAMFIVQCAQQEEVTEEQIVKEIANKTAELLNNLKSLAHSTDDGKKVIALESLKERKMTPATENFLFTLAASEGLVEV